ncbi:MAG: 2-succinyl-5-enolpyruvyl-6-hydroxy-3-cyclohexene-1-carboxylic-acid synthase [Clostridia bacterium]|nr:2-succinyl-5-enolpyruvyl-6-hydroxy-3-cyclohexene-1-carboxylic-acid synthase [Clostridia bacterium]
MNSSFRSIQILIDLLKQYNIKDIVLSPGGSDIPLIHSIESDDWFECYSVVDERSAAYFAMGVAQQKNRPVACVCTSGTAVCNYLPGITEAFYQSVPVLAITADKNPYYQGQLEIQKIEQKNVFNDVIKKSVELPLISNSDDEWLCNRLVNEALLALTHHGTGPVHINVPVVGRTDLYDNKQLPKERKINIVELDSDTSVWEGYAKKLSEAKRVLFVMGQNVVFTDKCVSLLNQLHKKSNCVYSVEHLSNLECNGCVYTYPVSEINGGTSLERLVPDLVVSVGNNLSAYNLRPFLRRHYKEMNNWYVSKCGSVRDAYKCLTAIFEMSFEYFLERMLELLPSDSKNDGLYEKDWNKELSHIVVPEFKFSNMYVASKVASIIPENSVLHLAILNSTRIMQYYKLAKGVQTYSNVGALGIDGCLSTFAGQAASTNELAFLIIGDLSFFYDMNAAGLRSIGPNVRIILLNNGGGSEFHFIMGKEKISTINEYICAEHGNVAAGWATSLGYDYYTASNAEELEAVIEKFGQKSDAPMFLEVLTDMEEDARITNEFYKENTIQTKSSLAKKIARALLGGKGVAKVKKILKVIKE